MQSVCYTTVFEQQFPYLSVIGLPMLAGIAVFGYARARMTRNGVDANAATAIALIIGLLPALGIGVAYDIPYARAMSEVRSGQSQVLVGNIDRIGTKYGAQNWGRYPSYGRTDELLYVGESYFVLSVNPLDLGPGRQLGAPGGPLDVDDQVRVTSVPAATLKIEKRQPCSDAQ